MASAGAGSMKDLQDRVAALERQVAKLQAIHELEQLRFAYWFAVADKDLERLVECFAEDVRVDYGFGIQLTDRAAVREFFRALLQSDDLIRQVPRGANPQLTLISETEAQGRWLVEVTAVRRSQEDGRRISVQYFERYRKTQAGWKICELRNDYLGFESFTRREGP